MSKPRRLKGSGTHICKGCGCSIHVTPTSENKSLTGNFYCTPLCYQTNRIRNKQEVI
jgi:hypothetical protein